jgi:hypothetical protein
MSDATSVQETREIAMTEEEYWDAQREAEAYYEQEALQSEFYEWLSAFEFAQRALDRMMQDAEAIKSGAVEMFRAFLQKQWEEKQKVVRCC